VALRRQEQRLLIARLATHWSAGESIPGENELQCLLTIIEPYNYGLRRSLSYAQHRDLPVAVNAVEYQNIGR
jgi:hypothetical protein